RPTSARRRGSTSSGGLRGGANVEAIDDADDRGIDGDEPRVARECGLARADEVDEVTDPGLHPIDRGVNVADGAAVLVDGLDEQQLRAREALGLALGDDGALDDPEVHRRSN